jgi:hypothetical protein
MHSTSLKGNSEKLEKPTSYQQWKVKMNVKPYWYFIT